jgi:hypothetical protein
MMRGHDTLPDHLQWTRETLGEQVLYRFANGLSVKTEVFYKADPRRILPLGTPQAALMNHMLHFPEVVRDKHIFEPFAGSGALGLMALKAGARHADFLDINPRAVDFQRENAARNGIPENRFQSIEGDVATFRPEEGYDLILANPPFVPTPEGIAGTLTSNGGSDGNRFVEILLRRLEQLLRPQGSALIYVLQILSRAQPLLLELASQCVGNRPVDLTPAQARPISFEAFCRAYLRLFPASEAAILRWKDDLIEKHGGDLNLCHYVVQIGPRGGTETRCVVRDDFRERFGESFLVPSDNEDELAFGRVFENAVPGAARAP